MHNQAPPPPPPKTHTQKQKQKWAKTYTLYPPKNGKGETMVSRSLN